MEFQGSESYSSKSKEDIALPGDVLFLVQSDERDVKKPGLLRLHKLGRRDERGDLLEAGDHVRFHFGH